MLWLKKNGEETWQAIHGVDYFKGLKGKEQCGRVHKYNTKYCRPVLYTDEDKEMWNDQDGFVRYEDLEDREKLILGNPIFFQLLRAY
jgi:hypothetical protein